MTNKLGNIQTALQQPEESVAPDLRGAQRFTLVLRVGKLITGQGEFLCVLRDISGGGLKVRLFHELGISDPCELELSNGANYRLEPVWQRDCHVGFRFADGWIDIHEMIEEVGQFPKRHIRLRLNSPHPVLLAGAGLTLPGHIHDISQHGTALKLDGKLPVGVQLRLDAFELPTLHGRVRWRSGGLHGLVFQQGFRLDELARLVGQLQLGCDEANLRPALTRD